jgi:hypothetical protein
VRKVVEGIFKDEKECNLRRHQAEGRKRHLVGSHAEIAADGVEEVDEGEFAGEVGEEDDFGAFPDLGVGYALFLWGSVLAQT